VTARGTVRPAPLEQPAPTAVRPWRAFLGTQSVAAVGAVLLWSSNALAATFALAGLTVFQLLTLQFGAATLVLVAVRARRSRWETVGARVRPRDIPVGLVGLTGTIVLQNRPLPRRRSSRRTSCPTPGL